MWFGMLQLLWLRRQHQQQNRRQNQHQSPHHKQLNQQQSLWQHQLRSQHRVSSITAAALGVLSTPVKHCFLIWLKSITFLMQVTCAEAARTLFDTLTSSAPLFLDVATALIEQMQLALAMLVFCSV
jgi:hypothetical protein